MPCYKRPRRTTRAIRSIQAQTMPDFEAWVMGDGCPVFDDVVLETGINQDPRFNHPNFTRNYGGCGYFQTNFAIREATAPYFCFMANDDVIHRGHLQNYLHAIEGTDYDFVYFDYLEAIHGGNKHINAAPSFGRIGHCALVIRTAFLKKMPPHSDQYGHDNDLIENMLKAGARYKKAEHFPATYRIMNYNKTRADVEGLD